MEYRFWIIGIGTILLAAAPLGGQEAGTGVTAASVLPDGQSPAMKARGANHGQDSCRSGEPRASEWNFEEKLRYFAHHSFGPGPFIGALFSAGPEMANPPAHYPGQWRQGGLAFGKLYGDALALETAQQTGRFLTGVVLHEDPRYSASSSRNLYVRTVHAIVFTAFDESDSGRRTLALSNFAGAASAGFVGNAYLPRGYNDTSHAMTRTGIAFGSFAVANLGMEFSPELRRIGRGLHVPKFLLSDQPQK